MCVCVHFHVSSSLGCLTHVMKLAVYRTVKGTGTFAHQTLSFGNVLHLRLICVHTWSWGTLEGMWRLSGRAFVSHCPPAGTSAYSQDMHADAVYY